LEWIRVEGNIEQKGWQSCFIEKETELGKYKTRIQELLQILRELEEERNRLIVAKLEIKKELKRRLSDLVEVNGTFESLIKECEEKMMYNKPR